MDDILEKVYPNMEKSNFQHLFILHDNPKHDFELNFVAAESVGGRYFPVYFDKYDRKYFEAFGRYIHNKYPKLTDPNSPELRRGLADVNKYWNSSQQSLFIRLKNEMSEYGKAINNREDFERFLKQSNFIIDRKTDTSITVKSGDTKIKLTGKLCNNVNTRAIDSENVDVDERYKELSRTRYTRLKNKYKYLTNYEYPEQRNNIGQYIKNRNANSASYDSAVYGNPHERVEKSQFADSRSSYRGLSGNSERFDEGSGCFEQIDGSDGREYHGKLHSGNLSIERNLKTTTRRISEVGTKVRGMLSDALRNIQYVSTLEKFKQEWGKNLTPNGNKMMRLFLQIIKDIEEFLHEKDQQKTQKQQTWQQLGYPPPRNRTVQTQPARDTQSGYGYDR